MFMMLTLPIRRSTAIPNCNLCCCRVLRCLCGLCLLLPPAGQGVNSALEDVCVLEQQLFEASAGNLSQALPGFEQQRLPDSAALVKLVQVRNRSDSSHLYVWPHIQDALLCGLQMVTQSQA
jgi:2-polyprenyl-6-methoxyphenol hydroxylase-like FAD-dependent oxidoreductase